MTDIPDLSQFPKSVPNPLTASLPAHLKDPANFRKIKKALLEAGRTTHSHGDILEWSACRKCQQAEWNRKEMMFLLGFTSAAQYLAWHKIHEKIRHYQRLGKYNDKSVLK